MNQRKIVITGAGGFLGKALAMKMLEQGFAVYCIQRGEYPELTSAGAVSFQEDIANPSSTFDHIFKGADAVFHIAAKVGMWGPYEDFYRVNVEGTKNILKACLEVGVPNLVYTSSPSVVANGEDLKGVDENFPYPDQYKANYPKTKAIAEKLVLDANNDNLRTCSLRPHLIWGKGDTNLIPTIIDRAKAGRLLKVGKGDNKVDLTYIDDCVSAHICAYQALTQNTSAAGKAYFISQGEPVLLWKWIDEILIRHDLQPVKKSIPAGFAYFLACVFEVGAKLMPGKEPLFSRFLVEEMASDHYFDISRAKDLLNFSPRYSMQEALNTAFPLRSN